MKDFALRTLSFCIIMSMFLGLLWGVDQQAARTVGLDASWVEVSVVNTSYDGDVAAPTGIEAAR